MSGTRTRPLSADLILAVVLNALGDETRLRIVRRLAADGEVACGHFGLDHPKSTMSHHFRVLISAGIIDRRREGTAQFNRLRREELDRCFPGLLDSVLVAAQAVGGPIGPRPPTSANPPAGTVAPPGG